MSTMGTDICGSSSRGMVNSAIKPTAKAVNRNKGVSGERIVARVIEPERSGFMSLLRLFYMIAALQSRKNLVLAGVIRKRR